MLTRRSDGQPAGDACHTALAMTLTGMGIPEVYIGSFSDWSSRNLLVNPGPRP